MGTSERWQVAKVRSRSGAVKWHVKAAAAVTVLVISITFCFGLHVIICLCNHLLNLELCDYSKLKH